MIRKYYLQIGIASAIIGIIAYSFSGSPDFKETTLKSFEDYKNAIINGPDPLVPEEQSGGFDFFEPEKNWVLVADFKPEKNGRNFEMLMTDSTKEQAMLFGIATLTVENKPVKLLIFEEENSYLLPEIPINSFFSDYLGTFVFYFLWLDFGTLLDIEEIKFYF